MGLARIPGCPIPLPLPKNSILLQITPEKNKTHCTLLDPSVPIAVTSRNTSTHSLPRAFLSLLLIPPSLLYPHPRPCSHWSSSLVTVIHPSAGCYPLPIMTNPADLEHAAGSSSSSVNSPVVDKDISTHVEQVHTNERVPGHPGYYEKDGLRTYGDDEDHDHEPPVSLP